MSSGMRNRAYIENIRRGEKMSEIHFNIVCPECKAQFNRPILRKGGSNPFVSSKELLMDMPNSISIHCNRCGEEFLMNKIHDDSTCYGFEVESIKRKEESMSLMEYIKHMSEISNMTCTTKKQFGEMMHDPNLTDDEKRKIAQEVFMMGGYDGLND